jgi:hypothetical protein
MTYSPYTSKGFTNLVAGNLLLPKGPDNLAGNPQGAKEPEDPPAYLVTGGGGKLEEQSPH